MTEFSNVPSDNITINLNSQNFDNIINEDIPSIVDFWAEWCGPCKIMHPIFEKLAEKYSGKIRFSRLNVDEGGEIAARYQIFSIPTFAIFQKGKLIERVVGAVGENNLDKVLTKYI